MKVGPVMAAVLAAALLVGSVWDGGAEAQQTLPSAAGERKKPRRGPKKVIEMDTLEVLGKVQKPRVYYLIGRGELKYEGLPMDRDLLKEVEDSVEGPPF